MKKKIIMIVVGMILMFLSAKGHAITNFYDDAVIQEGDVYDYVHVYNDAIIDISGGIVTALGAYDSSTINLSGGVLDSLSATEYSTINLSGDTQIGGLGNYDSGITNMYGGTVGSMKVGSSNPVNLHGGVISDYLKAVSTVNIYGYGFEYDPLAGDYRGGQLTGFWLDDTPFSIDLFGDPGGPSSAPIDTYSHIVLIPEPATILLLGLGGLFLRKRN
jgi:hypothetical protein